ncbi:MAG: ABC transporter substrate-binding protein [Opitutaceae bacterium]
MRIPKPALTRLFTVFLIVLGLVWLWGRLLQPGNALPETLSDQEKAVLEAERQPRLDPDRDDRIVRDVDYSEGAAADWFPRNEAPVLKELVASGVLPPVAERVGSEPLVLEGPDGIGKYGGYWADAVTWESEVFDRLYRHIAGVTLLRWSPSGYPIVPHVARDYEASDDLRVWTFHLRRGMRWSDGYPFTTADIDYWYRWELLYFQEMGDPVNMLGYRVLRSADGMGRLEVIDDLTFRFVFPNPAPFFPEILASTSLKEIFAPRHYLERFHPELGDAELIDGIMKRRGLNTRTQVYREIRRDDNPEHPRLNPWLYRRYKTNSPQVFVRNPYFWAVDPEGNQLPYIDRITLDIDTPELFALKTAAGGYPAVFETENLRLSNYGLYMNSRDSGNFDVRHFYSGQRSLWTIIFNLNLVHADDDKLGAQKAVLLNRREFRRALSLAINREAIIKAEFLGMGEPAQADPGLDSPFHNEDLYRSAIEYDPEEANRLLDEVGLTGRDADGFRTLPDGSPMVWFIPYRSNTLPGPFQFVIDDWAAVGIRAIARQVSDGLISAQRMAANYEIYIHSAYVDFVPIWDPTPFVPFSGGGLHAPLWAIWFESRFRASHHMAAPEVEPPPEGHFIRRIFDNYLKAMTAPSREEGLRYFQEILETTSEELFMVSIASPPPAIAVIRNDFMNVPRQGIRGNFLHTPLNMGSETFFFEKPTDSAGAIAQLKSDLVKPSSSPVLSAVESGVSESHRLGGFLRFVSLGIVLLGAVMVGVRHPYVGRRLLMFIPVLLVISAATFVIIQIAPGNIIETRLLALEQSGTPVDRDEIERIKSQFHLDEHPVHRYLRWIGAVWFTSFSSEDKGLLQGDLGVSLTDPRRPQPVNELVGDRILFTVLISLGTILFTWSLALPIGIFSAVRQYSIADYALTFLGFIGMSIPGFLLALLIMYWGGRFFGLDLTGLFSPEFEAQPEWTWGKVADLMRHIWVPLVVLGVQGTASMIRIMRGNLLDELRKPYVTTARAKGVRPFRLIAKYPVRVALNPFVSTIGSLFPELISGGAIVAVVLGLPTVGPMLLGALLSEDIYMAGSMLVVLSLLGVLGTLVSDLLLMWLDPRIRMEGGTR